MNKTVGLLSVFAFSFALHAFGEEAVENVFSSEDTRPLNDPACWSLESVPSSEEGAVISGGVAILSPGMQGFSSYTVKSGATLLVGPERILSDVTLEAGANLSIGYTRVIQGYSGYIQTTETLVGWMPPECSISEIADISGYIGGTTWHLSFQNTPYGCVTQIKVKSDVLLECQFQNYNSQDGNYTKGTIVEFSKDSAGNIYAKVPKNGARYFGGNHLGEDLWTATGTQSIAVAPNQGGYGVQNISFTAPAFVGSKRVCLTGSLATTGEDDVFIDVSEGVALDLSNVSFSTDAKIVKRGKGVIIFGEVLPSSMEILEGILVFQYGVEYDISRIEVDGSVDIKVNFEGEICEACPAEMANGKTKYLLSYMYAGVGSWNDSDKWENGSLPGEADTAYVVGKGAILTIDETLVAMPKEIVVMDGAKLVVAIDVNLSHIKLLGTGAIEIASTVVMSEWTFVEEGEKIPSVAVMNNATLTVPGGSKFGSVSMTVKGLLKAEGAGGIVLGYASAGETRKFNLLVDGGSIETEDGNIDFACPEKDGVVLPILENPWTIKSAVLTPSPTGGFNFGKGNSIDSNIAINFYNTTLAYYQIGVFYISGDTKLSFLNGSKLYKNHDVNYSTSALYVEEKAKLYFEDSELFWGMGAIGGAAGCGPLSFDPSAENWCSLELVNSKFYYYHLRASSKAVIRICNSVYTAEYASWNYFMPFDGRNGNKDSEKYSPGCIDLLGDLYFRSKSLDNFTMPKHVPFIGSGNIYFEKPEGCKSYTYIVNSSDNSATGSIMASDGVLLVFASEANWAGTVVYNNNVKFDDLPENSPGEITVGALDLQMPLVYRVWESGNDKINFTGSGIISNGYEVRIVLQNGFVPTAGTVLDLGTVPSDFKLSSIINRNNKWIFSLKDIEEDETRKILQVIAADVEYVFNGGSGEAKVVDLSNPSGWLGGVVPDGQEISIDGVEVVVADSEVSFASIKLKNGATLVVRRPVASEYVETKLPSIELSAGTELRIESGAVATVDGTLTTVLSSNEEVPEIFVASEGVLNVQGRTKFKNCSIVLNGTLATITDGGIVFGYALPDETARFSMFATNATIASYHGSANVTRNASRIDFASPEVGGKVVLDAPVELVSTTVMINKYDGFAFGVNNPSDVSFMVVADNTRLDYGAETVIAGGANLMLTNNASLFHVRDNSTNKRTDDVSYPLIIKEFGRITLVDGGTIKQPICHIDNDYTGAVILNPSEPGWAGIEVLDGGVAEWRKINGKKTAAGEAWSPYGSVTFADSTLCIGKGYWHAWTSAQDDLLDALDVVEIHDGKTLFLKGIDPTFFDNGAHNLKFLLTSPFTGSGNIVIANTRSGQTMRPVVMSGENTNTGTIEVLLPSAENKESYLYFQNGANWAGRVVANGRMEIVDKVTGSTYTHDSPVTVNFAKLDLQADFPVKVWKDENGNITGNDTLNVGEYINNGGRLVPTLADEGEFVLGDKIVLGEIGDSSPLPCVAKGWTASRKTIDGKSMLVLSKGVGFLMIVR